MSFFHHQEAERNLVKNQIVLNKIISTLKISLVLAESLPSLKQGERRDKFSNVDGWAQGQLKVNFAS